MTAVRAGAADAFAILYCRHFLAAERTAWAESDNASDREDAVADAFISVFQALRSGKGPERSFRPYLLTAVRRIAQRKNRQSKRTPVLAGPAREPFAYDEDALTAAFNSASMATAFNSLTRRWQLALWYVDIQAMKPVTVGPLLELSPNAVSALVLRAREGLRLAYLQAHVGPAIDLECEKVAVQLGAYSRKALAPTARETVHQHLHGCTNCAAILGHLNDVQAGMRTRSRRPTPA